MQAILLATQLLSSGLVSSGQNALGSNSPNASLPEIINVDSPVHGAVNATAWALIYTYPLYIFANWAGNVLRNVPVNTIYNQLELATPNDPGVIKPNIDTLYSRVILDLSEYDVVLTVPNITSGDYWNYPVIDAFGNIIAEIGSINDNAPGQYLIRRSDDALVDPGIELPTTQYSWPFPYQGVVNLPTTFGTMLIRHFLPQNTTANLDILHKHQNESKLQNVTRAIARAPSPPGGLSSLAPNGTFLGIDTAPKLLKLAASIVPYAQPQDLTERYRAAGILGAAGIYDGSYNPVPGVNLTYAEEIANASITADIETPSHVRELGNNWQVPIVSYQANYGKHYAPRAYVAIAGYQQQTVKQTLYPGYGNIGFTSEFALAANKSLLLIFSGKPPLKATGFWSLAIYGADQYLIPNSLERYEVGDRSYNLTYQTGEGYVYGPDANTTFDGPFQVLLQDVNVPPPSNWTGNWVPSEQSLSFIMRWYAPEDALTNGTYVYPVVETINQIL